MELDVHKLELMVRKGTLEDELSDNCINQLFAAVSKNSGGWPNPTTEEMKKVRV